MKQYDIIGADKLHLLTVRINEKAAKGWTLYGVMPINDRLIAVMERDDELLR